MTKSLVTQVSRDQEFAPPPLRPAGEKRAGVDLDAAIEFDRDQDRLPSVFVELERAIGEVPYRGLDRLLGP